MFFILSKTIGILIRPLILTSIGFLFTLLGRTERIRKSSFAISLILFFFFSNEFIANEAMTLLESPMVPLSSIKSPYEWGIMLCGVTKSNEQMPDRVMIGGAADRVNHTIMLYKKGLIRKILISGGSGRMTGNKYSEATALLNVFTMMGVPAVDIQIESQSRNTYENAKESIQLLKGVNPKNCVLITSASHMPRSIRCFRKQNFDCDAFPVDTHHHPREFTIDVLFIPSLNGFSTWDTIFRETIGLVAYKLAGYI